MNQKLTAELFELKTIEPRMSFNKTSVRKSACRDRCLRQQVVLRFGYSCKVERDVFARLREMCTGPTGLTALHYDALVDAGAIDDEGNFDSGHVGHSHLSLTMGHDHMIWLDVHEGDILVMMRWDAKRERDIISEAIAHEIFTPIMGALIDAVHVAWTQVVAATIEEAEHAKRVGHANATVRHLAELVRARARKVVRVAQRRAAIDAEYEAEKLAQVDAVLAELDDKNEPLTLEGGATLDPRSLAAARVALKEVVSKKESRFGRHDEYNVNPNDVD